MRRATDVLQRSLKKIRYGKRYEKEKERRN